MLAANWTSKFEFAHGLIKESHTGSGAANGNFKKSTAIFWPGGFAIRANRPKIRSPRTEYRYGIRHFEVTFTFTRRTFSAIKAHEKDFSSFS